MVFNDPYKNDYDHRPEVNEKGRFKDVFFYKGEYHELDFDAKTKKVLALKCLFFGILMGVFLVIPGLLNQPSSRSLSVCLSYVIMYLPLILFFFGALSFMSSGTMLTRKAYDKSLRRMRDSAAAFIVISVISLLIALVWFIKNKGGEAPLKEVVYMGLHVPQIAVGVVYGKFYNRKLAE